VLGYLTARSGALFIERGRRHAVRDVNQRAAELLLGGEMIAMFPEGTTGDVYLSGRSIGGVSEAVGAGLRLDLAWFTFVERTILRFDAAQTENARTPPQFWLGIEHPF